MEQNAFVQSLAAGPMLVDGGMGTSLVEQGAATGACFEALNVEDPDTVEAVHRGFVDAGASAVWTNTFGANRFKLAHDGSEERVAEFVAAGVGIARRAGVLVVGSVGPLGVWLAPYGRVGPEEAREAYVEQIGALAAAGVDAIAIETQTDVAEIAQAVAAAREAARGVPLIVTATFTRDDRTPLGSSPADVAEQLVALGVDALGANCGQGPEQVLRVIRAMRPAAGSSPLVARPNAGGPQQVGGRFLYPATPAYVAEHARDLLDEGVVVVGGCCGTGPDHTRAIAAILHDGAARSRVLLQEPRIVEPSPAAPVVDPSGLAKKLAAGRFIVAVEVEPPRGHNAARLLAAAQTLAGAGADVIDVADSPMAKMRMSPWAACRLIQEEAGVETVLHFPTRGRNLLRLQGDLLAVRALGVRNLFVCVGDPVTIGDFPHGTDEIDVTATGLMSLVTERFNAGTDHAGSPIGDPAGFLVGCALSPDSQDLERELKLTRKKVASGAAFALSQPIYDVAQLDRFRAAYEERYGPLDLPIFAGVLPLISARHADFIHNEVPGVAIPEPVLDRMRASPEGSAAREGLAMAVDLVAELRERASGIYVMPQLGRFDLAAELVEAARR